VEFSYENQGANTYLVYEIASDDMLDTLSLGMITNNNVPGLAQSLFTQMDNQKYIKYNITSKISMKQFFSGVINRKRLIGTFSSIVEGLISSEDYMIDLNSIILNLDYIFVDVSTCDVKLICLPITSCKDLKSEVGKFFKDIMVNTQFDNNENTDHVAKLFNFLNSSHVFSLLDFKKLLEELDNDKSVIHKPSDKPTISKAQHSPQVSTAPSRPITNITSSPSVTVTNISKQNSKVNTPIKDNSNSSNNLKSDKKITMLGLLMHYSKENKELYKKQKEEKKAQLSKQKKINNSDSKSLNKSFKQSDNKGNNAIFAIPGQSIDSVQPIVNESSNEQVHSTTKKSKDKIQYNSQQPPQLVGSVSYTTNSVGERASFGETTVLGGGVIGETTVLNGEMSQEQNITPYLVRSKNNEQIILDKPIFRIGKEKSFVDYFIGDNTAISRSHANVITREEKFFILDTNSTNHTFVNGVMIQSNTEIEINHGDRIRLGNEEFEFKLY